MTKKLVHKGKALQKQVGSSDYDTLFDVVHGYEANMPKLIKDVPKKERPAVKRFFKDVKLTKKKYF